MDVFTDVKLLEMSKIFLDLQIIISPYCQCFQVVAPKRESLQQAEQVLSEQMEQLHIKQAELQVVTDKLKVLTDNLDTKQTEKTNLEDNIELTKVKIIRAEKLISGLGGEKERWTQVFAMI